MNNSFTNESTLQIGSRSAHEVKLAALLDREIVPLQSETSFLFLNDHIILVTGAAGSIGTELCRQLLDHKPALVIGLDINETGLFDLAESLRAHPHGQHFQPHIGDITDRAGMEQLFSSMQPQIVFHVAAYKHVPLLEQHPKQAIRTNVLGTYHLCLLAQKHKIANFIFVSTDKAVTPACIMGASKRFGELIIRSLANTELSETCFCSVRFGNVIGSRGSVVPTFIRQIEQGGPVTVTDHEATRYFMTSSEACGMVILSAALAETGNIYLLDMGKPIRIVDLALKMIHAQGLKAGTDISIVYTGLRPGERLHELLFAPDEELTSTKHNKIFCITCRDPVPTLTAIAQWVQILANGLLNESDEQLRQYIFEFISQYNLAVVHR
jgi:FlaA1/EpsC-like NDP-sugar epimerase